MLSSVYQLVLMKLFLMLLIYFFNDTATTEIYTYLHTLSLHDALPICSRHAPTDAPGRRASNLVRRQIRRRSSTHGVESRWLAFLCRHSGHVPREPGKDRRGRRDRKSTRLNSSH